MPPRQARNLPRLWLMTDERMGDRLFDAISRLPKGSGIVFRHYSLAPNARRALLARVQRAAKRGRHLVTVGGRSHGRKPRATTAPVHSLPDLVAAERAGARLLFVSPVFVTRSHVGAKALGRVRFGLLVRRAKRPVIALGGMNDRRARTLAPFNIYGWAGIDAFD